VGRSSGISVVSQVSVQKTDANLGHRAAQNGMRYPDRGRSKEIAQ